ncbi:MAG: EAL domain-containing protein [Rhodospirillales bacterium]|nr:EAL domain-containing protein [Rhodospirillales bacterium]
MKSLTVQGRPPLILIVDDDSVVRFVTRQALERAGFAVVEAAGGDDAMRVFAESGPAVVMLDIVMPGMDGFAVCAAMRNSPSGGHTPIMMMTGLDDSESIDRAFEAGATTFITKPLNLVILSHRLRYILRTKQIEDELRDSEARLARAQRMARLGHWQWEPASGLIRCSEDLAEMIGLGHGEQIVTLDRFVSLIDKPDRERIASALASSAETGQGHRVEYAIARAGGAKLIISQEGDAVLDAAGAVEKVVGIAQDITERRVAEDRIRNLAHFDSVTGLPNRTYLVEILGQTIVGARRQGRELAVLILDIDHFKRINDTLGHGVGDTILKEAARRLVQCIRGNDRAFRSDDGRVGAVGGDPDSLNTVSRLGGDEFVIVLGDVRRAEDSAGVARRVAAALGAPFSAGGSEIRITISTGISVFPVDGDDAESLLKNADAAMFHAKEQGRDRSQFFTASLNERAVRRFSLETNLRKALANDEFLVYYQPKIDIASGGPCGMEALVRWRRGDGQLVSPLDFIPVAEETGLIVPIGDWVMQTACAQTAAWTMQGLGPLRLSVNLSAVQFRRPGFVDRVGAILDRAGLAPDLFELELTEGILVEDTAASIDILRQLNALGLSVSVDDFGTGYSSLSYLKRFPLDALKIDRSFVRDIATDPDDAAIVTATIALAHSLRLRVIAEGVETEAQLAFLRSLGCDEAQGYLYSPPVPATDFGAWLTERRRPRPVALTVMARS